MKAIQLSIFKDMEIDYNVLQQRLKHQIAKKRRNGGVIWRSIYDCMNTSLFIKKQILKVERLKMFILKLILKLLPFLIFLTVVLIIIF